MLYEKTIRRSSSLNKEDGVQSAYEKMLSEQSKPKLDEALGKEKTKEIRDVLKKELKLTNRDVSVKYDGSIRITLKTTKALPHMKKIKEVSEKHESYQRDQASGTILRGGNTFVFVNLDWKFRDKLVKQIEAEISKKITDEFMHGEGGGNTITVYGAYDVVKWRTKGPDEFGVIHKQQASAGPVQRSIIECAGRVLSLMLEFEDAKALKKLK
jgi:hypothetical protein